jgi:choline dehydrogenase-like flavoprotein
MPCLRLQNLGIEPPRLKSSLAQLVMFHDELGKNVDAGMAAMFTYRSLLLFKLVKEVPLNFRDGRAILQYLQSALVIAGIHHPEDPSASKYVQLKPDSDSPTGDVLSARYGLSDEEQLKVNERMWKWRWAFRQLGCVPLKIVDPGHGASLHYAGCLPFSEQERKFCLHPDGRLYGTRRVFIADGSGFRHLPAKGLTLTLMANAHLVAKKALSSWMRDRKLPSPGRVDSLAESW